MTVPVRALYYSMTAFSGAMTYDTLKKAYRGMRTTSVSLDELLIVVPMVAVMWSTTAIVRVVMIRENNAERNRNETERDRKEMDMIYSAWISKDENQEDEGETSGTFSSDIVDKEDAANSVANA